jgi:hypothetical protein
MDSILSCADTAISSGAKKQGVVADAAQCLTSVVTGMRFAAPAEAVWKRLMFYEQIERRPPWLLRQLLPIPIRAEGRESEVGDEIKCQYESGYLVKRVTRIIRRRKYSFDVIEQNLTLHGGIRLSGGSYTICELPDGRTEVALETRYTSPNRPRWLCSRIETTVCHLFHRHILGAMWDDMELH